MSRRKARELALQYLYQQDIQDSPASKPEGEFWKHHRVDLSTREYAELLVRGYQDAREQIDDLISDHLKNWTLRRVAYVDRNILRVAVSELLIRQTPSPVVIDEAIEIAKKFGDNESREFVNGVLDAIRKYLEEDNLERA